MQGFLWGEISRNEGSVNVTVPFDCFDGGGIAHFSSIAKLIRLGFDHASSFFLRHLALMALCFIAGRVFDIGQVPTENGMGGSRARAVLAWVRKKVDDQASALSSPGTGEPKALGAFPGTKRELLVLGVLASC